MNTCTDHPPVAGDQSRPDWRDRGLLLGILVLLGVRPLLGETFEPVPVAILTALDAPAGPTPATTAWLDFSLLALTLSGLLRAGRWRKHPLATVGLILAAVAVAVSSSVAADKRQPWLVGSHLLINLLVGCTVCTIPRSAWMRNLLLAVLLATLGTTAVKCVLQRTIELAQTKQQWEQVYKPELLRQGFDPASPFVINFERRLYAAESHGFLGHPNLAGSCLALGLTLTAGLAAAAWSSQRRGPFVLTCGLGLLLAAGLWTTGSKGAGGAALFGTVATLLLGARADWCSRRAPLALASLVGTYLVLIGAVAAWGVTHATLPHSSLAFRWHYWTGALRAWQDAPLTGLGRGNFAAAYLLYKAAAATEEVRDPHNVWVTLLTELGPLGLIGAAWLAALAVFRMLRGLSDGAPAVVNRHVPPVASALVAAGVLALQLGLCGLPVANLPVVVVWVQEIATPWLAILLTGLWLSRHLNTPKATSWLAAACLAAWLTALLHGLVDFALLTPGGLAVALLCLAVGVSTGDPAPAEQSTAGFVGKPLKRWTAGLLTVLSFGLLGAHGRYVAYPASVRAHLVRQIETAGQAALAGSPADLLSLTRRLTEQRPVDPVICRLAAQKLLRATRAAPATAQRVEWLERARFLAQSAVAANDRDCDNFVTLANILDELAISCDRQADREAARRANREATRAWDAAVALYPTDPRTRIAAGLAWARLWRDSREPSDARHAVHHLRQALWIDDQRPPADTSRLQADELARISATLSELPSDAESSNNPK